MGCINFHSIATGKEEFIEDSKGERPELSLILTLPKGRAGEFLSLGVWWVKDEGGENTVHLCFLIFFIQRKSHHSHIFILGDSFTAWRKALTKVSS